MSFFIMSLLPKEEEMTDSMLLLHTSQKNTEFNTSVEVPVLLGEEFFWLGF